MTPAAACAVSDTRPDSYLAGDDHVSVEGFHSYALREPETNVLDMGDCTPITPGNSCRRFASCIDVSSCVYPSALCPGANCPTSLPPPVDLHDMTAQQAANARRGNTSSIVFG